MVHGLQFHSKIYIPPWNYSWDFAVFVCLFVCLFVCWLTFMTILSCVPLWTLALIAFVSEPIQTCSIIDTRAALTRVLSKESWKSRINLNSWTKNNVKNLIKIKARNGVKFPVYQFFSAQSSIKWSITRLQQSSSTKMKILYFHEQSGRSDGPYYGKVQLSSSYRPSFLTLCYVCCYVMNIC